MHLAVNKPDLHAKCIASLHAPHPHLRFSSQIAKPYTQAHHGKTDTHHSAQSRAQQNRQNKRGQKQSIRKNGTEGFHANSIGLRE